MRRALIVAAALFPVSGYAAVAQTATGPFRIVAPWDKRAARSVRMLTRLTVVSIR